MWGFLAGLLLGWLVTGIASWAVFTKDLDKIAKELLDYQAMCERQHASLAAAQEAMLQMHRVMQQRARAAYFDGGIKDVALVFDDANIERAACKERN